MALEAAAPTPAHPAEAVNAERMSGNGTPPVLAPTPAPAAASPPPPPTAAAAVAAGVPKLPGDEDFDVRVPHGPVAARLKHQAVQTGVNFAGADAGAKLVTSSKEMQQAKNVLTGDRDRYAMTPCSAKEKWMVVQLREDAVVDTIVIGNKEHYASGMKDFRVLGSTEFPTLHWTLLGTLRAEDNYKEQAFPLSREWVRYVKLVWLSHYGSEQYCTLTTLKLFGQTMFVSMQEVMTQSQKEVATELQKDATALVLPSSSAGGGAGSAGLGVGLGDVVLTLDDPDPSRFEINADDVGSAAAGALAGAAASGEAASAVPTHVATAPAPTAHGQEGTVTPDVVTPAAQQNASAAPAAAGTGHATAGEDRKSVV